MGSSSAPNLLLKLVPAGWDAGCGSEVEDYWGQGLGFTGFRVWGLG